VGCFEYVQLFVISNGTHTKYYSNTTRHEHIKEANKGIKRKAKIQVIVLNLQAGGQMALIVLLQI